MFLIGKTNPDKRKVGSIVRMTASMKATCCVSATVEMRSPNPRHPVRKISVMPRRRSRLPFTATSKRIKLTIKITIVATNEMIMKGIVFPMINSIGLA